MLNIRTEVVDTGDETALFQMDRNQLTYSIGRSFKTTVNSSKLKFAKQQMIERMEDYVEALLKSIERLRGELDEE